ncbi:hypothetical protein B296_00023938 [Ensete ventricosum]|uniref:Uncharacterized protein n=1 Tax=Ensete ventricosum TaxID=4639 RepID=A0A426ZJB2_ENSVE|nr:hypothetical protein B296_00023938 [Ensete ventricosum]
MKRRRDHRAVDCFLAFDMEEKLFGVELITLQPFSKTLFPSTAMGERRSSLLRVKRSQSLYSTKIAPPLVSKLPRQGGHQSFSTVAVEVVVFKGSLPSHSPSPVLFRMQAPKVAVGVSATREESSRRTVCHLRGPSRYSGAVLCRIGSLDVDLPAIGTLPTSIYLQRAIHTRSQMSSREIQDE